MRALVVVGVVAACSGSRQAPADEPIHAAAAGDVELDTLVGANVTSIMRSTPELFLPLRYIQPLLGTAPAPCWSVLEQKLVATYQLTVPKAGGGNDAYFILEGDLPQAEVAACIPKAVTEVDVTVKPDGELLAFEVAQGGVAHAAWRGRFVVIGSRGLVNEALTSTKEAQQRWRGFLAAASTTKAPIWWGAFDGLFANLFGVQTVRYEVAFERLETSPNLYFAGRAVATYATAGDAAIVARRIKQGEAQLPFDEPGIVDSIKRFKVKQSGTTVEAVFDLGMFGGITAETLAALAGKVLAQQDER